MNTISFRASESEARLIRDYASANSLNLSAFVRELVLDRIEEDLRLDEERILRASERIGKEKAFDHAEVWRRLGV